MIFKEIYNNSYPRYTVNLGLDYNFFGYLHTFENAIEILLDDVAESGAHVDRIAYPILFMIRHSLEIGFKGNIAHFSKYSGKKDHIRSNDHRLTPLFQAFKTHVSTTVKVLKNHYNITVEREDNNQLPYYDKVETLLALMNTLDEGSDAFRYPVNKNYEKVFRHDQQVNLIDLIRLFDECMILLKHTKDVFAKYTDVIDRSRESG